MGKVKAICQETGVNRDLAELLRRLNPALQGWCTYFQPGVSSATFQYLRAYLWQCVWSWIRRKHPKNNWKDLRRQYCGGGWWPSDGEVRLFNPGAVKTTRYRYRGAAIANPWTSAHA
jgi:RNA-directed DNA polymerase